MRESAQVQRYYDNIRQVYADKTVLDRDDYRALRLRVGLDEEGAGPSWTPWKQ